MCCEDKSSGKEAKRGSSIKGNNYNVFYIQANYVCFLMFKWNMVLIHIKGGCFHYFSALFQRV